MAYIFYLCIPDPLICRKITVFFLFGARGTGKTSLLQKEFSPDEAPVIDLLLGGDFLKFSSNSDEFIRVCRAAGKPWIIIDGIQKIPALLDGVHFLIEKERLFFALTGSSARNLRRGGANLLAGRAL
jgi:uncharacterized protein